MSVAIETRELSYRYEDGTQALEGVSLKAERGEGDGHSGRNGAGSPPCS